MKTTWQDMDHPSWDVGRREDSSTVPLFGSSPQRCWGEDTIPKIETDAPTWIQHPACLLQGQGSAHTAQESLPLLQPSPPTPHLLPFPALFPSSAPVCGDRHRLGCGKCTSHQLPCQIWVSHPGWKPTPHCSPTLFPAGLIQQLRGLDSTGWVQPRRRAACLD